MSLVDKSCEKCWLPPQRGSTLCRKCDVLETNYIKWVRYHEPTPNCKLFCESINSKKYCGPALPEECIECCNFLLGVPTWIYALKNCIKNSSHDRLTVVFSKNITARRHALLDYVSNLLETFIGDNTDMCRRILNALLDASHGKQIWILEELVQRPILYPILLAEPLLIPYHLTEDFYGYFQDADVWWTFWEKMPASTKRRIRFRCMTFKEELIEKTWEPKRVLAWCIGDIDEMWLN